MPWIELTFDATHEAVDWVKTLLAAQHYSGEMQTALATNSTWDVGICLTLPDTWQSKQQLNQVIERLSSLHRTGLISDPDWAVVETRSAVQRSPGQPIGDRFLVLSADAPEPDPVPRVVLRLGESLAFGSGLHPATQLSVQLIERYVQPGLQTLDLGCGSGILSLAMATLGAQVLALDNDAGAVGATQSAAQLNQLSERITAQVGSLGTGSDLGHWMGDSLELVTPLHAEQSFDLIAANILGRIHTALAKDYAQTLKPGGLLLTAGFTTDYEAEVEAALGAEGLTAIDRCRMDDWVAIAFRR